MSTASDDEGGIRRVIPGWVQALGGLSVTVGGTTLVFKDEPLAFLRGVVIDVIIGGFTTVSSTVVGSFAVAGEEVLNAVGLTLESFAVPFVELAGVMFDIQDAATSTLVSLGEAGGPLGLLAIMVIGAVLTWVLSIVVSYILSLLL